MKDSFVIYTKYEEQINMLSDEQAGVLFRALMRYQRGAELPKMDGVTTMAFSFIKQQIEFDNQKYEEICQINKVNGQLGGRPAKSLTGKGNKPKKPNGFEEEEKKPNGFSKNRTKPKKPESESDNDYDTDIIPPFYSPQGEAKKDFEEEFFALYPRYAKDRAKMRVDVDYKRLIEEFGKSKYLRSLYTVKQINEEYPLILQGDYRDKEKQDPFAGVNARAERDSWYAKRRASAEGKANKILERFLQDEEFKRIHRRLNAMQCELARAEIDAKNGDTKAHNKLIKLTQEQERLRLQRRGIIERNGYEEEDLQPKWHCRKCSDTGYDEDGKACDCYNKGE